MSLRENVRTAFREATVWPDVVGEHLWAGYNNWYGAWACSCDGGELFTSGRPRTAYTRQNAIDQYKAHLREVMVSTAQSSEAAAIEDAS